MQTQKLSLHMPGVSLCVYVYGASFEFVAVAVSQVSRDRGFVQFLCEYVSYVVGRGLANFSQDTLYTYIQSVGRGLANFYHI
jgi:hypothetical protein